MATPADEDELLPADIIEESATKLNYQHSVMTHVKLPSPTRSSEHSLRPQAMRSGSQRLIQASRQVKDRIQAHLRWRNQKQLARISKRGLNDHVNKPAELGQDQIRLVWTRLCQLVGSVSVLSDWSAPLLRSRCRRPRLGSRTQPALDSSALWPCGPSFAFLRKQEVETATESAARLVHSPKRQGCSDQRIEAPISGP